MKFRWLLLGIAFFATNFLTAQVVKPVKWDFRTKKISATEFELIASAQLEKNWAIYSQYLVGDDGPIRTEFTFKTPPQYQLIEKPKEVSSHRIEGHDKMFDMNVIKFKEEVTFVQRVRLPQGATTGVVTGNIRYGCCDDSQCLPPEDVEFSFKIDVNAASKPTEEKKKLKNGVGSLIDNNIPTHLAQQRVNAHAPNTPRQNSPQVILAQNIQNIGNQANKGQKNITWSFSAKKISDTEFDIYCTADLQKGWHTYSQTVPDGGPNPTIVKIENAEAVGKAKEESQHRHDRHDPVFDMKLIDFEQNVSFIQRVRLKSGSQTHIQGTIEVQICNERECIPPDESCFNIELASLQNTPCTEGGSATTTAVSAGNLFDKNYIDHTNENTTCEGVSAAKEDFSSLWSIFIAGFLGGIAAFFMPCIFPMVPLTVGFFTKSSKDGKSNRWKVWVYGLSIIGIYTVLGVAITAVFGVEALNQLSTNAFFNTFMFVLLLVFAFSFFGYFEITLPSSWTTKTDALSARGGILGIFFMAATLALVSFSCTGPIIGSLLAQTFQGGYIGPIVGMFAFSLALSLPFVLFAAFPSWLKSMPRSGGWLNEFKVTLGFIEIALAFKFLSVADMTKHWKILPYELMLGIWVLCALGLALYFTGKIRFPHDSPIRKWAVSRYAWVSFWVLSAAYLGMGFRHSAEYNTFRTPALVSGLMPPAGYSYIFPKECPLGMNCFHDFEEGVKYAKQVHKPILLDFTGYGCVNCRKMEDLVWSKPEVDPIIRNQYVLISLYTDDRTPLATPYTSAFDGKLKKTIGQKWSDFEVTHFNKNSQPYYVLLNTDLKVLNTPTAYDNNVQQYKRFLECGLSRFNK